MVNVTNSSSGWNIGSISRYDAIIKRRGILSRCEEGILFGKIISIQNLIVRQLLANLEILSKFKRYLQHSIDNDEILDVFNFNTSVAEGCTGDEIITAYLGMIQHIQASNSLTEDDYDILILTFSNEVFEKVVSFATMADLDSIDYSGKSEIIEYYRQKLFEYNIALTLHIALNYTSNIGDLTIDDIIQEGMVGLKRAIKKYNPYMGTKFSTMATQWISQEIIREIDNKSRLIAIPCNILSSYKRTIKQMNKLISSKSDNESVDDVIDKIEDKSIQYVEVPTVRLESPNRGSGRTQSSKVMDVIADPNVINTDSLMMVDEIKNRLRVIITSLDDTEQYIMNSLFGYSGESSTNKMIMEILNLKGHQYNKIKNRAMDKIKDQVEHDPMFNNWMKSMENA